MDNANIVRMMEEMGIKDEDIGTLVNKIKALSASVNSPSTSAKDREGVVNILKSKIKEEPDWRKRASMAAQIISMNFDE